MPSFQHNPERLCRLGLNQTNSRPKYGYSQFCALFATYVDTHDLVATLHHDPGKVMFIDWAGDTLSLVDAASGALTTAYLFTAVLPFSGVIFVSASVSMKSPAWLDAHVNAFAYFGGVPQLLIPDNPTTSTHRRQRQDPERVINARYQQLADHYGTTVVPARVKKPRDKAAVERAVKTINTRVIGYLDQETFHTLAELNDAIAQRLQEINHDMLQADGTSRWERFTGEEQALLSPLPEHPFTDVVWKSPKVGRNYHVSIDTQKYSVPFKYAGQLVRARLTTSQITIFDHSDSIIAEHARLTGRKGQYSTDPAHVPPQHRDLDGLWTRVWFLDRAERFGPATIWAISQVLDRHDIEAHGYLDCYNILDGLGKKNRALLEAASERLQQRDGHVTYTMLKRIMASITSDQQAPTPLRPAASTKKNAATVKATDPGVFVRDASHYATEGGL
ncbi:IS21 family transposase [Gulosibacter chungangensis]|uniref:IS21 family transposase n=1 Tax=Gulosibacter chungangensis TaxID=979746 RepID=UPI001CE3C297|nr:IS21 family transposase [Gulosibacter chungangensis]